MGKPLRLFAVVEGGLLQGIYSDDPELIGEDVVEIEYGEERDEYVPIVQDETGQTENAFVCKFTVESVSPSVARSAIAAIEKEGAE